MGSRVCDRRASLGTAGERSAPHNEAAGAVVEEGTKLRLVVEMLREQSLQKDPQRLVEIFRQRSASTAGGEYLLSLSRRGLESPRYRITRHADWPISFNPWENQDRLPLLRGGVLGEAFYGDEPRIIGDLSIAADDPGYPYLRGARSILCLPQYDGGVALNMVVRMSREAHHFDPAKLPDALVISNLFGRATNGLVLANKLERANTELDYELEGVGQLQRFLLPQSLPDIDGLDIAASYQTATRAGGDYYDFFPLCDGRWGIIIADVSGHGAPAAVVMAIVRTILHTQQFHCRGAADVLHLLNRELSGRCGLHTGTFVTAFYAVYDPTDRSLRYSCAGHVPPLLIDRSLRLRELDDAQSLPLAVQDGTDYPEARLELQPGYTMLLYTDGITEATAPDGRPFDQNLMLEAASTKFHSAQAAIDGVERALERFVGDTPQQDDRTLLALRVK